MTLSSNPAPHRGVRAPGSPRLAPGPVHKVRFRLALWSAGVQDPRPTRNVEASADDSDSRIVRP